jgi:hypothetical protein
MVDDAQARLTTRSAAYAHVVRERTHAAAAPGRFALYRSLIERAGLDATPKASTLHTLLDVDEAALSDATVLHGQGRVDAALALYLGVLTRHPDFHLPWERGALIAQALGASADASRFGAIARQALERALAAADTETVGG